MSILSVLMVAASVIWVGAVVGICIRVIIDVIKEVRDE